MESAFNFGLHLHNGDSLERRTVRPPQNRPPECNPPNDWESSAIDAIRYDRLDNQTDWGLARTLYRFEAYNGFRSRVLHNINTPDLWSFSNHVTRGRFVADGVWDANAVSRQAGAAVLLKALVERGIL